MIGTITLGAPKMALTDAWESLFAETPGCSHEVSIVSVWPKQTGTWAKVANDMCNANWAGVGVRFTLECTS